MIYKPFHDLRISQLGLGNMRLPVKDGAIEPVEARQIIEYAYAHGVNYFDTAYRYHGGESEPFVSEVLSQYPRDTWYLATKFPGHMMAYENGKIVGTGYMTGSKIESVAQIFEDQLSRCGVEYFDFYLLHNLCESSYDLYTNAELGVVDYLLEQKRAGRIRHLGLSSHGRADTIDRFLNWRRDFEFVQIQLNYMDWTLQDAAAKYEVITRHGLPVIVMEPVRGGRLASLGAQGDAMLQAARPGDSVASWAFRFLQGLPNVLVTLSGMTTMAQIEENVATYEKSVPLTEKERAILEEAMSGLMNRVPCTACAYCVEGCPRGLEIPKLISMYNEIVNEPSPVLGFTLRGMAAEALPGSCIACGNCTRICPQGIDIPDVLSRMAQKVPAYLKA